MVHSYPADLDVQGAEIVEENPEADTIVWTWKRVEPTDLRLDQRYAQVMSRLSSTNTNRLRVGVHQFLNSM